MKRLTYRCSKCGAECRAPWWEGLELPEAEDRCPGCKQWAKFVCVELQPQNAGKPVFGKKAA